METQFIQYEVDGGIATITLSRPEAANGQTVPLLDGMKSEISKSEART